MIRIIVLSCLVLLIVFNAITINDGHNWGDDFAQYIINAKNIVENKPFMQGVMLDSPVTYPPGFALLLTPLVVTMGINFVAFKWLNIFFWFGGILFIFLMLKRHFSTHQSMAVALLLGVSPFFFIYKQNVLADIPFFFFVCTALYYFEKDKSYIPFLLMASMALWVRSAGSVLFIAAMGYFLLNKDIRRLAYTLLVLIINVFCIKVVIGDVPVGFWGSILQDPRAFGGHVMANFATAFEAIKLFFLPQSWPLPVLVWGLLYVVYAVFFINSVLRAKISYLDIFFFCYLNVVIFWSGFPAPAEASIRLILPLLPVMMVYALRIYQQYQLGRRALNVAFVLVLMGSVLYIYINRNFNDDVIFRPVNQELFTWVKVHTDVNDRLMFSRPRLLALMTGRVGTAPFIGEQSNKIFYERLKGFDIKYIIVFKEDRSLPELLEKDDKLADMVWENKRYKIFKVKAS